MNIQVREVYQCEHCKRKMFSKSACAKHEKFCLSNPVNQNYLCSSCSNCENRTIEIEPKRTRLRQYCNKFGVQLYFPPIIEKRGYKEKFPDLFPAEKDHDNYQEPMRKECPKYSNLFSPEANLPF